MTNSKIHAFPSTDLLFVWYVNRSGSTLLLSELNKYNRVVSLPEGDRLVHLLLRDAYKTVDKDIIKTLNFLFNNDAKLKLWKIQSINYDFIGIKRGELFFYLLNCAAYSFKIDYDLIVFKDTYIGRYFDTLVCIKSLEFRINMVLLCRDPRSIYFSQKRTIGSWSKPMSNNPITTSRSINNTISRCFKLKNQHLISIIKYEDLLELKTQTLESILSKFNVADYSLGHYDYHSLIPDHLKQIHEKINFDVDSTRIVAWKNNIEIRDVCIIERKCMRYMSLLGYKSNFNKVAYVALKYEIKDLFTRIRDIINGRSLPSI